MVEFSEKIKNHLQSRLACAVSITLLPVTAFVCFMFYIFLEGIVYFSELTLGIIIILFFVGACFDQFAHVFCCVTGSRKGVIMRVCAIVLEAVSILWCAVKLLVHTAGVSRDYMETRIAGFFIAAIILFVFLWRVLEIVNLLNIYSRTMRVRTVIINLFGVMGIFIAVGFLMITFVIWQVYIEFIDGFGSMILIEKCMIGFTWLGVTFIPIYIFLLSLHALKTEKKFKETNRREHSYE